MLPSDAAARLKNRACEDDAPPKYKSRCRAKKGSTVVSTVKGTRPATSSMCEKYLHDRDGHAPLGRRYAAEKWDAKGLAVPTLGYETPPCASAQLLLEQRLVLPS